MTRKASLQQTADRMVELQKLFAQCFTPAPGWRDKPLKSNNMARKRTTLRRKIHA